MARIDDFFETMENNMDKLLNDIGDIIQDKIKARHVATEVAKLIKSDTYDLSDKNKLLVLSFFLNYTFFEILGELIKNNLNEMFEFEGNVISIDDFLKSIGPLQPVAIYV